MAAISSTDAWAVGLYNDGRVDQTLVEHWDGKTWRVQPSPNRPRLDGGAVNQLYSVAPTSANNTWAVGFYDPDFTSREHRTLIERWNSSS